MRSDAASEARTFWAAGTLRGAIAARRRGIGACTDDRIGRQSDRVNSVEFSIWHRDEWMGFNSEIKVGGRAQQRFNFGS